MKKIISLLLIALLMMTLAACGGGDDDPEDILDCILNPEAEGCDDIIPGDDDPLDDRSAEEILADAIIENWDGDVTHLDVLLDTMDFTNSMELVAEFNFEATDNDGVDHIINVVLTDSYLFLATGDVLHRHINLNIDGEFLEFTIIYEEVDTGVILYVEFSDIRTRLEQEEPEMGDILDVLGVDEDWLRFSFDDSLANLVEIEVMRELLADIFFNEMGLLFFYELEDEIETDTGLLLADYNLNIGLIMDTLAEGDYTLFATMLENIDLDTLLTDLDEAIFTPELVAFMQDKQVQLEGEGFDVVGSIAYLEANGTEAFITSLSTEDLDIFIYWLTTDDWRLVEETVNNLYETMPWQVISAIDLPTEDLETGATITWVSYHPELITAEGVVTVPEMDMWDQWAGLEATVTVGEETRMAYFEVTVPPVNCEWCVDEYPDYHDYDDDDRNDPIGDYLKDTVELSDIILFIEALKDNLTLVDFTALELETVDHEALIEAIYDSQVVFDAYIVTLSATAPESAILLSSFSPIVGYLEEFVFLTDVRYAIDNLSMFDDYLTLDYYLDNSLLEVEIDKTATFAIETTVSLAPNAFGALFVNVLADTSDFLAGFTETDLPYVEYINCPVGELDCEEFPEYDRLLERFNLLSEMEMIATYDPSNLHEIEMEVNFTEFANAFINLPIYDDELLNRAVDKLYNDMPWQVVAVINLPTVDLENGATISWASDRPDLIDADGNVYPPGVDEWDQWVMLTATVTVGSEEEILYFSVTVPPINADWMGDEYNNYNDNNEGLDISNVTDLSLTITVRDNATILIPTTYEDVNAIAEDFARFSLNIMAFDYLERITEFYDDNPGLIGTDYGYTLPLDLFVDVFHLTPAFDGLLSTVYIGGSPEDPELIIDLYWMDGTQVFTSPLTFTELDALVGEGTGGPATNAIFQTYVNRVDGANFSMEKLIFVYIFNDSYDEDEYDEYQ